MWNQIQAFLNDMIGKISYLEHENARLRDENARLLALLSQNEMLGCWDYAEINREADENKHLANQSIYYLSNMSTPVECDSIREIITS